MSSEDKFTQLIHISDVYFVIKRNIKIAALDEYKYYHSVIVTMVTSPDYDIMCINSFLWAT